MKVKKRESSFLLRILIQQGLFFGSSCKGTLMDDPHGLISRPLPFALWGNAWLDPETIRPSNLGEKGENIILKFWSNIYETTAIKMLLIPQWHVFIKESSTHAKIHFSCITHLIRVSRTVWRLHVPSQVCPNSFCEEKYTCSYSSLDGV